MERPLEKKKRRAYKEFVTLNCYKYNWNAERVSIFNNLA